MQDHSEISHQSSGTSRVANRHLPHGPTHEIIGCTSWLNKDMANPAELLFNLFTDWNNPHSTTENARADNELVQHRRAVAYLEAIDQLLNILESQGIRTSVYRRQFPTWLQIVFNYPKNWQGNNTGGISQYTLDPLETLIGYLDDVVPTANPELVEKLQDYLESIWQALSSDDSLPDNVRLEAAAVIKHVQNCIDDLAVIGDFDFRQAVDRLISVLIQIHKASEQKDKWRNIVNNFVWPFVMGNVTAITSSQFLQILSSS